MPYPTNAILLPQRMIEALGLLQAQAVNMASSSIYIYDLVDQHTLCISHPVAAMLGYTSDKVHAMEPIGLASLIHPDDLERVADHYQRLTTLRRGQVITTEYRMQRADKTWCQLRSQETLLIQAIDGFPLQILGMLQDTTQHSTIKFVRRTSRVKYSKRRTLAQRLSRPNCW
jgi:PAS domain S-box-containing protein